MENKIISFENFKAPIRYSIIDFSSTADNDLFQNKSLSDIELNIVISGKGIHKISTETNECQVGDLYIISNGISHCYYPLNNEIFPTVLRISFNPKNVLSGKFADSTNKHYCYGIFRDNLPISYALLNSKTLEEIRNISTSLEAELKGQNIEHTEAAKALLTLLLINLARYINLAKTVLPNYSKDHLLVSTAIKEITEKFTNSEMTLESIANSLYISKSHLSRLFQKVTGESFLDYVRKVRIENACCLLQQTDLTNEEIVRKCGIKDIPTFYRHFKSVTGMTPLHYRRSNNTEYVFEIAPESEILNNIAASLKNGRYQTIKQQIENALNMGIPAYEILDNGLSCGMNTIADQFKNNEIFVPTVLSAAKAMNIGIETLQPYLVEDDNSYIGTVCIGTVRGDLHDIGKNLVKILMESKRLRVIDLGVDVAPQDFIDTAIEYNCKIICCSALLTTTMGVMKEIIDLAKDSGIRDNVKILIGGAPLNEDFCKEIGADFYAPNAAEAAEAAVNFCR